MTSPVSSSTSSPNIVVSAKPVSAQKTGGGKPAAPVESTKATISAAAKTASQAAVQEATETATQSAQEAQTGDRQAQKLLAQQVAAHAPIKTAKK